MITATRNDHRTVAKSSLEAKVHRMACNLMKNMMRPANLPADVPQHLPDELFTTLLEAADIGIERIVSHGHSSPDGFWYDQDQHEWIVVFKGEARLRFEDESKEMRPGDFVNITVNRKHRVEWTTPDEPTVWLAGFYE